MEKEKIKKRDKENLLREIMKTKFKELTDKLLIEDYDTFPHDTRRNKALTNFCRSLKEEIDWLE